MRIRIKKLDERAKVPQYATPGAAGADLYALLDDEITIAPGETAKLRTGLSLEIPEGWVGLVYARSGMALKRGLAPANKVGVIDSDYRGELHVTLHNHSLMPQKVLPEERVAQLVIAPVMQAEFEEAETLEDTQRGAGGFGSTGTR